MDSKDLLPSYLDDELDKLSIRKDDILFGVPSDLNIKGLFSENWLVLTQKNLFLISGSTYERKKSGKKPTEANITFNTKDIKEYSVKNIKKMSINDMVSGGVLIADINDEEKMLCRFTSSRQKDFGTLVKIFDKIKKGEQINLNEIMQEQSKKVCPKCGRYYPDMNRQVCPYCLDKRSVFFRVLSFMKNYKLRVGIILMFMFISAGANIFRPYLSGNILFDEVLAKGGKYYGQLGKAILLIAGTQLTFLLFSIFQGRVNAYVSSNIIYDIKVKVFKAMQDLSMSFFNNKQTGGLLTRVNTDSNLLMHFFHDGMPYVLVNSFVIIGTIVVMLTLNVGLTILVLLPIPLIILISKKIFPRLNTLYTKRHRTRRFLNALTNDTLTGFRVVKAFGKEDNEIKRFGKANSNFTNATIGVATFASTAFPLMHLLVNTGTLIIWGYGGYQVIRGNLTFGSLVAFNMYLRILYQPVQFMSDMVDWWSYCMTAAQRIFEICDALPEVYEIENPKSLATTKGHIQIKNITFSYEPNKPVIHNVNMDIKPGETIGLVGKSGAGKSTLANLVTRLYDVDEGAIEIDGINIKEYSLDDLHSKIGMVMQDTFLFSGSIEQNIAYGKPDTNKYDIIKASVLAGAHEFIMKLPDKYDTLIGKNGQDLSGGQRQRLSIARTILHNPDILILDEATASVDTETEIKIQSALDRLIKSKTTIVIAHRLSTLRNADRIIVIEKGKIIEAGTLYELNNKKGEFYKMLNQQKKALEIGGVIK